jgi:hypothetical protein
VELKVFIPVFQNSCRSTANRVSENGHDNKSATIDDRIPKSGVHGSMNGEIKTENASKVPEKVRFKEDRPTEHSLPPGAVSPTSDNDVGGLYDLLDDYDYTSQPTTPGSPPPAFTAHDIPPLLHPQPSHQPHPKSDHPTVSPITTNVTNIHRIDANPPSTNQRTISPPTPSQSNANPNTESQSFASEVTKALDSTTLNMAPSTVNTTPPPSKSPAPSASDIYSSTNYWAHMRAQLKQKRTVSSEMSRTPSHQSNDSTLPSNRNSQESNRSAQPPTPAADARSGSFTSYTPRPIITAPATDGRSGSFTSYTARPKFPEQRRPSIPGINTQGIPYGRPKPSDTGRQGSLTGPPPEMGMRRGSGSDAKRPVIDTRGGGGRSASNSPITGSMPFSNRPESRNRNREETGGRPGSRNRNREEIGMDLPVFAPRDGLPTMQNRDQSPVRVGSPARMQGRPQSPMQGRPQSPMHGRPQSPMQGRPQSPMQIRPQSPMLEKSSRTPSPRKDGPSERTQSPVLHRQPDVPPKTEVPLKQPDVLSKQPEVPPKELPPKDLPPKDLPPKDLPPKDLPPKELPPPVSTSTPPPPVHSPQPVSPPKNIAMLQPITIPTKPDRNLDSPSPDHERKDDDNSGSIPPEKRTTVFFQAAGKQKQSLPPLPAEPAPSLPPMKAVETDKEPEKRTMPVAVVPPSPLIPPPSAPVLESRLNDSDRDSDSDLDDKKPVSKATESSMQPPSKTTSTLPPLTANLPDIRTRTTERVTDSSEHKLPELDVGLRPITWGPLSFEESQSTPSAPAAKPLDKVEEEIEVDDSEDTTSKRTSSIPLATPVENTVEIHDTAGPARAVDDIPIPRNSLASVKEAAVDDTTVEDAELEESENWVVDNESTDEDAVPAPRIDKGKGKEVYRDGDLQTPVLPSEMYPEAQPRQKFIDRDITSFIANDNVIIQRDYVPPKILPAQLEESEESSQPRESMQHDAAHQDARGESTTPSTHHFALDYLPDFMLSKDIPDMSTVAQRVGAYQSRRDQMVRADTGLRGWLLQIQQVRPTSITPCIPPSTSLT